MIAGPTFASPGVGECELSGQANFHPGPAADPAGAFADGFTVTTTKYAGDGAAGVLAFEVADPTQCNAPGGVTNANIDGFTGIGSSS